jgi:hypothetical protein
MGVAKAREDAERLEPYIRACVREELPDALDELLDGDDDAPNGNRQPRKPAPKAKANGNGASGPKANGNGSNVDPASGHRPPPDTEPSDDESLHWTSKTLW